jgi:hypothetical protein
MAVTINASTTTGLVQSADTSGIIQLQSNGTTAVTIDTSQRVAFVAGTAALPAITTTGDTNTGIFFSAADTIDFAEGGTATGQFDSSGNFKFNSGFGSVATAYGCRAWVNFDGISGTTIRGSGNISSVTRSSAGRYDINFTTAMPDANYSPVAFLNGTTGTGAGSFAAVGLWGVNSLATGSVRVEYYNGGFVDSSLVFVAVFR